jgi:hypothetical protein
MFDAAQKVYDYVRPTPHDGSIGDKLSSTDFLNHIKDFSIETIGSHLLADKMAEAISEIAKTPVSGTPFAVLIHLGLKCR